MRKYLILLVLFIALVAQGATYLSGDAVRNPDRTKIWLMPTLSGSSDTLVSLTSTSTLTNKTLSGNTATNLVSGSGTMTLNTSGTVTLPNATDTLVGKATTDVLTNKTLSGNTATNLISGSGTLTLNTSGTVTLPNATDTLVGKATTDTLTNKTLTSPVLTTPSMTSPTLTSYTQGSMLFVGAAGVLTQDNANLFYNAGNAALLLRSPTQYGRNGQALELNQSANYGGAALSTWSTTAAESSRLDFNRSKSASLGTYTVVATGDVLGQISFRGADGSVFREAAGIKSVVGNTPGSSDMPGNLVFQTTPDGSATLTDRMDLLHSGRFRVYSIHNNASGCGSSSTVGEICSFTYTPTIANGSNVAASSVLGAHGFRVGNIVTVYVDMNLDPTTGGGTQTDFGVTLPVTSDIVDAVDCIGGILGHGEDTGTRTTITGDTSNNRCTVTLRPAYSSNENIKLQFSYEVN